MKRKINNDDLVDFLISNEVLTNDNLIKAFRKIDRKDFVLSEKSDEAYLDIPLEIGFGQTISQPQVVAFMLELLDLHENQKVLDIGSGSGYTTALISQVIGMRSYVFGLEKVQNLVDFGKSNLKKYNIYNAFISRATYDVGITNKKFDRILVSASAESLPIELLEQLEENGKLVIPIKNSIYLIEKKDGIFTDTKFEGFSFVPLVLG